MRSPCICSLKKCALRRTFYACEHSLAALFFHLLMGCFQKFTPNLHSCYSFAQPATPVPHREVMTDHDFWICFPSLAALLFRKAFRSTQHIPVMSRLPNYFQHSWTPCQIYIYAYHHITGFQVKSIFLLLPSATSTYDKALMHWYI